MQKTWTDEEREEAADACAMMASSDTYLGPGWPATSLDLTDLLDHDDLAYELATRARAAAGACDALEYREVWAEAEARCGWCPGEDRR